VHISSLVNIRHSSSISRLSSSIRQHPSPQRFGIFREFGSVCHRAGTAATGFQIPSTTRCEDPWDSNQLLGIGRWELRFFRLAVSWSILSLLGALACVWLIPTSLSSQRTNAGNYTKRPRPSRTGLEVTSIRPITPDTKYPLLSYLSLPICCATFVVCRSLLIPVQSTLSFHIWIGYVAASVAYCSACTVIRSATLRHSSQ
jgi:hypothetical protein